MYFIRKSSFLHSLLNCVLVWSTHALLCMCKDLHQRSSWLPCTPPPFLVVFFLQWHLFRNGHFIPCAVNRSQLDSDCQTPSHLPTLRYLAFTFFLPSKTQGAYAYSVKEPLWDDCSHISMAHTSVVCAEVKRWKSPFLRTEFFLSSSPKQLFDPGFSILAGIVQGHQSQASDSTVAMELGYLTQEKREAR